MLHERVEVKGAGVKERTVASPRVRRTSKTQVRESRPVRLSVPASPRSLELEETVPST